MTADTQPEDLLRELREPEYWQGLRTPKSGRSGRTAIRPTAARVLPAIAALVIAVLAVTGIAVGFGSLHRDSAPAATQSPTRTPRVISSPAPVAAFTGVVAGPQKTYDATHHPPACALDQLDLSVDPEGGGAGGTYYQPIYLRNAGDVCTIAPDAVHVGGVLASFDATSGDAHGLVLAPGAVGDVAPDAVEQCGGDGARSNIDPSKPVLQITVSSGGQTVELPERFPQPQCGGPITVEPEIRTDQAFRFSAPPLTVAAQVLHLGRRVLEYRAVVRYSGPNTVVVQGCPSATEVVDDGLGGVAVRPLSLRCSPGSTLRPGSSSTFDVDTTVPARGGAKGWHVAWWIPAETAPGSTTCAPTQLQLASDGQGGGEVGTWFQHLRVRNIGGACDLADDAFTIGGRPATGKTDALHLPEHSTSTVLMSAGQECADGSSNVPVAVTSNSSDRARFELPIVVAVSGRTLPGLTVPFPVLACSPASLSLQDGPG